MSAVTFLNDRFHPVLQGAPFKHNPSPAFQALKPNICAQSYNPPLISPARMRLTHADYIAETEIF
jgi:hypothetical protein